MDVQHNGEEIVEDKDQDNGKNNGCRCSLAYPFGPLLSIKALWHPMTAMMVIKKRNPLMRPPTRSQDSTKPRMDSMKHSIPDSGIVHSNKPAADITDERYNNQDGQS